MKITCVGTDPAGLYLGILLKRRDPSQIVRFVDGAPLPSAPATIICNPLKPRLTLADAEMLDAIKPAIIYFDRVSIDAEGRTFETKGLKYATVDRTALVAALNQRVTTSLTPQGRQQSLADIGTELASAQVAMKDIAARQSQSQLMLQNLVDQTETVSSEQVATEILALQTRLQASYQTTSMLAQLTLVKFLPIG